MSGKTENVLLRMKIDVLTFIFRAEKIFISKVTLCQLVDG